MGIEPNRRVMETRATLVGILIRNQPATIPCCATVLTALFSVFLSVSLSGQTVGLGIAPLVAKPLQPLCWYRRRNCDELGFLGFLNL